MWFTYSLLSKVVPDLAATRLQTQRWEQGLAEIQHPVAADSLIPMFEGMVERAFSRNSNHDHGGRSTFPSASSVPRANSAAAGGSKSQA